MAMIDPNGIMPLNFFKYKGVYTGQHNGMRHVLLRKKIRQQRYLN